MVWKNPKLDWTTNPKNPVPEDFNRIEGNIDFLKTDIETKKGAIVDAMNSVGIASQISDTHATLASKITNSNQGTKIITPSTVNKTITKGFHSGQGYVKGDANLIAENIKLGKSIFGVAGGFDKIYTKVEATMLKLLGITEFPAGATRPSGRFKVVTLAGSYIYAPVGKTWIGFLGSNGVDIATEDRADGCKKYIYYGASDDMLVYEIDLPSIHLSKSGVAMYDFDNKKALMINISYASDRWGYIADKISYGYYGYRNLFTGMGYESDRFSLPVSVPVINFELVASSASATCLLMPSDWSIVSQYYTLVPYETVQVGVVPVNEKWIVAVWQQTYTLKLNGKVIGSNFTTVLPNTTITLEAKQSDHATQSGTVTILKIPYY